MGGGDELASEVGVEPVGQLDVEDDGQAEARARGAGEADVGRHGRVEVGDPALARDEGERAREARGIPGGEELLGVGALAGAAELVMGKSTGICAAVVRGVDPSWLRTGSVMDEIVRTPLEDLFR